MKKRFFIHNLVGVALSAVIAAILPTPTSAITGDYFDFNTYLRSGARSNSGATVSCPKNKGPANGINEFRLGNECGTYGELYFVGKALKAKETTDPFMDVHITSTIVTNDFTQVEPFTPSLIEAYFNAGNIENSEIKYWLGKRYYRDPEGNMFMNDDFTFANINGNGAGIYDLKLPKGTLALAYLLEQSNPNPPTGGNGPSAQYKGHFFDARFFDIAINDEHKFDLWLMYGFTPGGTLATGAGGTTTFDKTQGFAGGLRYKIILPQGTNKLSVLYGVKLLQDMTLSNIAETSGANLISNAKRLRVIDDLVIHPIEALSIEIAGRYEKFNSSPTTASTPAYPGGTWMSVGALPVYSFTKHYAIAGEGGFSYVKYNSDSSASKLGRLTIAPEIRFDTKYFSRPELRVFYTTSFKKGWAYGLQGEVWF